MPDSTASASFGPMPLTLMRRSKICSSSDGRKAVQHQRIFAHMRVDTQRDLGARLGHFIEGRERNVHVVADAVDIDDDAVRLLLEQPPAQVGNHSSEEGEMRASSWRGSTLSADRGGGAARPRRFIL